MITGKVLEFAIAVLQVIVRLAVGKVQDVKCDRYSKFWEIQVKWRDRFIDESATTGSLAAIAEATEAIK